MMAHKTPVMRLCSKSDMSQLISSDKNTEALLRKLAATPDKLRWSICLDRYIPRHFARFLSEFIRINQKKIKIENAHFHGNRIALDDAWPVSADVRTHDIMFYNCSMDAMFLDALMCRWLPNVAIDRLSFFECEYIGEWITPGDARGQMTVNVLEVFHSTPAFAHSIGVFTRSMRFRELFMDVGMRSFSDWFPYIRAENLQVLSLDNILLEADTTDALAGVIRRAHALSQIRLVGSHQVRPPFPDMVASAIGERAMEKITVTGFAPVFPEILEMLVSQQTTLIHLVVENVVFNGHLYSLLTTVIQQNPALEILDIGHSLEIEHSSIWNHLPLVRALLRHTHLYHLILEYEYHMPQNVRSHLDNNRRAHEFKRYLKEHTSNLRLVSVLVTGALRDTVYKQLCGTRIWTAADIERQVAYAIATVNLDVRKKLMELTKIMPLGDVFHTFLTNPHIVADDVKVVYVASVVPPNGFPGGVHIYALRGDAHTVDPNLAMAQYATAHLAPVSLRDHMCLFAVIRATKHVLTADDVAEICAPFGTGARLPPNPYTYPLTNGGMIARMPEVLSLLRKTFAFPVLLVRILGSTRRVPTTWLRDSVLPIAAAVKVFHHVVENDEVPAEEAVRILITFDVIFPVSHDRAVFSKSRNIPSILCRALAYLHSRADDYRVLSQDDTGSITFLIMVGPARGAQMNARLVGDAVAIEAENPDYADEARRMTHILAPIVDS